MVMNSAKENSLYHRRLQGAGYFDHVEIERGVNQSVAGRSRSFADESYARTERLAEGIRIKLLKVLTLTLLRELEGVGTDSPRVTDKFDLQTEVQHFEAELIRSALIMTGGRQRRAAKLLGMKVTTLHSKIRRYGLTEVSNSEPANGHEPSAAEAVRTSLELVEAMFEAERTPSETTPEIHVTGSN